MKYLFLIDVDGTIVPSSTFDMDKKISDAFSRIKEEGHVVAIVTGRTLNSTLKIVGIKEASYISGLMGSIVYQCDNDKVIKSPEVMDTGVLESFFHDLKVFNKEWSYKTDFNEKTLFQKSAKKFNATVCSEEEFLSDLKNQRICQLVVEDHISKDIFEKYPMFDYYFMPKYYTDVVIKGASKAKAVRFFKDMYPNHTVVAIGDSDNDRAMLELADISIAMGNASDEIKKICTHTTKSVSEYGVICAFEDILKISF